jgi:hypothetical protein
MNTPRESRSWLEGLMLAAAAAVAVVAIGRMAPSEPPAPAIAEAGMVSESGELTIVTFASGVGDEDLVAVLDQRAGHILVYEANQWRGMRLLEVASVDEVMERARAAGPGTRR